MSTQGYQTTNSAWSREADEPHTDTDHSSARELDSHDGAIAKHLAPILYATGFPESLRACKGEHPTEAADRARRHSRLDDRSPWNEHGGQNQRDAASDGYGEPESTTIGEFYLTTQYGHDPTKRDACSDITPRSVAGDPNESNEASFRQSPSGATIR